MRKRLLLFLGASIWLVGILAGQTLTREAEDAVYGLGKLHKILVSVSKEEWDVLQTSGQRGATVPANLPGGTDFKQDDGRLIHVGSGFRLLFPWIHAELQLNDTTIKDVGLRFKGNNSFVRPTPQRPFAANLKVKTDLFGGKKDWKGQETLNFHAGARDMSLMRESLSLAIFRAAGVPAPRSAYAEIIFDVPGLHDKASGGVFVVVENVNKQFLKRVFPPGTGLLMKPEGLRGGIQSMGATWTAYIPVYRPDRDATEHEQKIVMEFASLVNNPDVAAFRARIGTYLDVDEFLRFVAVHIYLNNNDSYLQGNHNYYLYLDPKDDKIRFIPWDEDLSMGGFRGAGPELLKPNAGQNALIYWLLDDPAVAERYRAIVKELSETVFTAKVMNEMIAEVEQAVPNRDQSTKTFLTSRVTYVQSLFAAPVEK